MEQFTIRRPVASVTVQGKERILVSRAHGSYWSATLKASFGLLALLGLLGSTAEQAHANLLINGSFENGPDLGSAPFIDVPAGSTAIVGWTVGGSSIDYAGPGTWNISDGVRNIDLDGSGSPPLNGAIAQTFATTPGQRYVVTFDLSGNPAGLPLLKQVEVTAGADAQVFTYDIGAVAPPITPLTISYTPETFLFTAAGNSTTLTFTSLTFQTGNTGFGPIIDNVVVVSDCVLVPSGAISWWPGDDNANDIVDGNPGTIDGSVTFVPGMVADAFNFDGSSGRVIVPDASNLDLTTFTLDAWVKPLDLSVYRSIVVKRVDIESPFNDWSYGMRVIPGGHLEALISDGTNTAVVNSPSPLDLGVYSYVAATYDGHQLSIYVNGVLVGSTSTTIVPQASTQPLRISGWTTTTPSPQEVQFWVGEIDEVELFNRALSSAEIQAMFSAGTAGKCKTCQDNDRDGYGLPGSPLCPGGASADCDDTNASIHPNAIEVCNGIDDNCNSVIDEGGDALCDDTNPCTTDTCGGAAGCLHSAISAPGPVGDTVQASHDQTTQVTTLVWSGIPSAVHYNTYKGTIPLAMMGSRPLPYDHACHESDDAAGDGPTLSTESATPPTGTAFYYLEDGENSCGEGSLGTGRAADGSPITRPNSSPCPTPP